MAIDELLIERFREHRIPIFRIYGWKHPAITIGRYQEIDRTINAGQCKKHGIPVIRRMTGGGAIYHNQEITYALACSTENIGAENLSISESFEFLNRFLIKTYKELGFTAEYAKYLCPSNGRVNQTLFCFSGNEEYDILINAKKIGGNAQRRFNDIIFQHGSIPIDFPSKDVNNYFNDSIISDNYTTIQELTCRDFDKHNLIDILIDNIKDIFASSIQYKEISSSEQAIIDELINCKYGNSDWNNYGTAENKKIKQCD